MSDNAVLAAARTHYDAAAADSSQQYERERLNDLGSVYPANYFRMQIMLNAFIEAEIKRVIGVGVGEGAPLRTLAKAGLDVWGFDISEKMVETARRRAAEAGLDPAQIFWGDVEDPATYVECLRQGKFDGLMAMGVMPHVRNDDFALGNMRTMVGAGGRVFIEFRNKLFSLFTFNRHTYDFIMDDLLAGVDERLRDQVAMDLKARLEMDKPARRTGDDGAPGDDEIRSKFHNPFEVLDLFERQGFEEATLHWYHYHPAPPVLEAADPALFRSEAMKMEHETSGWRGFFLCSAFVVEAVA